MKFFEKKSVIKIAEEDLKDAKLSSIDFTEENVKKRAFIDVLGARLAMKLLFSQKIQANNIYSLYTIHNVLEELDMADIYYQGIKIDVRLVFDKNEIFIPKQHYEYDLLPDLYLILCIKDNLSSAECLGFFEPKHLDKANANKDFYFFEYDNLIKPDKLKSFLDKFKRENSFEISEENFKNAESLFLPLVDKEITKEDKLTLFKQLSGSIELREKAIEFENFEIISRAIAKDGTLLHDDTLEYVGGIEEEEIETEIVEDGFDELLINSEIEEAEEELDEISTEPETDEHVIDVDSLPEFDTEDESFDSEEIINNIYSEFEEAEAKKRLEALSESEAESDNGNNVALIAGGAVVAAAGLGLAGEIIKGSASAAATSAEMQSALVKGVADATVEGIKFASDLLSEQDFPSIETETEIADLEVDPEEVLQNELAGELAEEFSEEFSDEIADDLPEFEDLSIEESDDEFSDIEEEIFEIEENLLESDLEAETEMQEAVLEDEIELVENADATDFEDIDDLLEENEELLETELAPEVEDELPEIEISEDLTEESAETTEVAEIIEETIDKTEEDETEDKIEDKTLIADMLHDIEALEDEDEEEIGEEIGDGTREETVLPALDAELPDFSDIEEIIETEEVTTEETSANESENIELGLQTEIEPEEEEEGDEENETSEVVEPTEFSDLVQKDLTENELPSFQDLVQKSIEEEGLPDFEYLVQNSIDETALPNFEHLVQQKEVGELGEVGENSDSVEEIETDESPSFEEDNDSQIENKPIFGLLKDVPFEEEIIPFAHHTEEALLNEDLPKLNLVANAPQEKIQELQPVGELEAPKNSLIAEEDDDDDKEGVFSLDDFDFKLLETSTEESQAPEPEKDLLQLVSNQDIGKLEEQDDEDDTESATAAIGDESDDFISQVDSFLGEVELTEEQRLLLSNSLLDEDYDSTSETAPPVSQEPAVAEETAVEFIEAEEDQDLLKVLFEKEKIGGLSDLEEAEEQKPAATPQLLTNLQNKKMVIAASIAGVVLVSFVVGGNLNSNQNINPNNPNNIATTAAPTDGAQPAPNAMGQPDSMMGDQMNGQVGGQMGGQIDGQSVQSLPGEDQQAQGTRDMGKAVSDAFSSEPVSASITKVAWEVPEDLAYNDSFRKYLQVAGKNLKLNLQNDLLLATEMAYSNKIIVDLKIAKDGSLQSENVIVSSGSKQIDKIVLQSVKETLKYLKMPSSELSSSSVGATLIINF